VKQTSWQEHLDAIREGKRELLELETVNSYTYEMTADDGTKVIFQYGGGNPLTAAPNAGVKKAATAVKTPATEIVAQAGPVAPQEETSVGARPRGNCSLSGQVVSATTGKPIAGARMYLHYNVTHGSIFINAAGDGRFMFKDIPKGPFSLRLSLMKGYQDAVYNPEGKPGEWPAFSLSDGEQRTDVVIKAGPACRIAGKIVGEDGKPPANMHTLTILAWFKKGDGKTYESQQSFANQADGSYVVDGLSNKPAYVMAINWEAAREGNAPPPIYYPGTFSRDEAKLVTFDKSPVAENIDIKLQKQGGLAIKGTVRDEAGNPVPETFVVVDRPDMLFDFNTAYSDQQGHYQIQGLGSGDFLIHLDAVHRGFVRLRTPIHLEGGSKTTRKDFALSRGALISGKLVDKKGNDWEIGQSWGWANIMKNPPQRRPEADGGFSLTNFRNKYRPASAERASGGSFQLGEGNYESGEMIFPTKSTFIIQGMMPGQTMIGFSPNREGQAVIKIFHGDKDIMSSGLHSQRGQEIKDVVIVIGTK
jgi:hypothetical protein